jgi:hypothetical protein
VNKNTPEVEWVSHQFEDVPDFLRQVKRYPSGSWIYRGQPDVTWDLIPKAGRVDYFNRSWEEMHARWHKHWDLHRFEMWRREAVACSEALPENDLECLAYAQHYGLATRLLDWSRNPLVALYFAAETHPSLDGAVLCHFSEHIVSEDQTFDTIADVRQYSARPIDRRILVQDAVFTYHPKPEVPLLPGPPSSELYARFLPDGVNLVRFLVPSKAKEAILKELSDIAVNRKSLFPDLEGLSHFLNWETRMCVERDN